MGPGLPALCLSLFLISFVALGEFLNSSNDVCNGPQKGFGEEALVGIKLPSIRGVLFSLQTQ